MKRVSNQASGLVRKSRKIAHGLLHDYIRTVHTIKLALSRHHDRCVSYMALLHKIRTQETSLQRLHLTPTVGARAYNAELTLQHYQAAAHNAQEEYAM